MHESSSIDDERCRATRSAAREARTAWGVGARRQRAARPRARERVARQDALKLVERAARTCGGLHGLTRAAAADLRRIGESAAHVRPRCWRRWSSDAARWCATHADRPRLNTPRQLASYLLPQYGSRPVEQFGIVLLDTKHRLHADQAGVDRIARLRRSRIRARSSARRHCGVGRRDRALSQPSVRRSASQPDDVALTTRMVDRRAVVGIDVLDHLILADQRYYSFMKRGSSLAEMPGTR